MCRRFTTNTVSSSTIGGVPAGISCVRMNCAEPAKTMDDIACAAGVGNPAATASAP